MIVTSTLFWLQAWAGDTNVWLLLGLFSVQQAFFAVNQPTRSAVLPRLLPLNLLPAANSLNMTVMQAGAIGGPLIAGALIPVFGFPWLYLIDTTYAYPDARRRCSCCRLPSRAPPGASGSGPCSTGARTSGPAGAADVVPRRHHRDGLRMPGRCSPRSHTSTSEAPRVAAWLRRCCSRASRWARARRGCSREGSRGSARRPRRARLGDGVLGARDHGSARRSASLDEALADAGDRCADAGVGGAADMASAAFRTACCRARSDAVRGGQGVFTVVVVGGPGSRTSPTAQSPSRSGRSDGRRGSGCLVIAATAPAAVAVVHRHPGRGRQVS